jgi:hypothetical protein
MSHVSDPPVFPVISLSVEGWHDPVIDELGHDPRSSYVEKFWLPVLGPSTVWFLRQLADQLDVRPEGFDLDLVETAQSLGVGMRGGRHSPMLKTVERSCRFGAARMIGTTGLAVRRRLAPLTRAQTERLPRSLASQHAQWLQRPRTTHSVDELRDRARSLALSMLELGEDDTAVERQLHRWRFHPAMASDALRWAIAARQERTGARPTIRTQPKVTHVQRPRVGAVGIALRCETTSTLDQAG